MEPGQPLPGQGFIYLLGLDWSASRGAHADTASSAATQIQHWRNQLWSQSRDHVVLYGSMTRQWQQLASSLRWQAPGTDWSWLPQEPVVRQAARLRPFGCEQCSDPDCERRLFDALRSGKD